MVKQGILVTSLLAFTLASPLQAQNVPADIPLTGPGGTLAPPKTPTYNTTGARNHTLDPTVTPPNQAGLTNIPIPSTTNRTGTNGPFSGAASPFCTTIPYGGTCVENKFRTQVDFGYMLPDDPIRNPRQPGGSHLHCFFGSGSANAYSTYKTLRNHSLDSTAAGTDVNATGYWFPCITVLNPYGDGKNYAIKPDYVVVYYTENPATNNPKVGLAIGTRYVFGFDMDIATLGLQYAWLRTYVTNANTAQGYARYSVTNGAGNYQSQVTWTCIGATPAGVKYLKNPDGSDPYGGTCGSGQEFDFDLSGPRCWDGDTLHSNGGYKHVIPMVWDTTFSEWVCPTNYYEVPGIVVKGVFQQYGWTDRQRWDLSSDIALRAAKGWNTTQVPSGSTFHADWLDGWDNNFRSGVNGWERNCLGTLGNVGHECNSSQINSTTWLKGGNAGEQGVSRNPQVDLSAIPHVLQTDPGWMLIPPSWSGALTAHRVHP